MPTSKQPESIDVDSLDGHDFEALIVKLLEKMGFTIGERKLAADGGIDIEAKNYEPLLSGTYIIQCKRLSTKVGEPIIRDLYGVVHSRNANKGLLITNSKFTASAKEFAHGKQLELVNGDKLRSLLIKHKILQVGKDLVILPNSAIYLRDRFVPKMKKLQNEYNDINNGLIYIERKTIEENKYLHTIDQESQKINYYIEFVEKNMRQISGKNFSFENDDFPTIKEIYTRIIKATQKLLNDYKKVKALIPPEIYKVFHQKYLVLFSRIFESAWKFASDIEAGTKEAVPGSYGFNWKIDLREENEQCDEEVRRIKEKREQEKKSNCFIATAAYGTSLSGEINILREFRDTQMMPNPFLKSVVRLYYKISPPIANIIARNNKMRKTIRFCINLLIRKLSEG